MTRSVEQRVPLADAAREPDAGVAAAREPEADASGLRLPDFFIVGHEKCGTTALYKTLRQHPQIFMPDHKEPRFFMRDWRIPDPDAPKRTAYPRTLEGYASLFAGAKPGQRVGEASPQYIRSEHAARLIAEVQPAARIIAILREPLSFLRTFHLNCVRAQIESERDLRKAIALEDSRRQGRNIPRNSPAPNRLFYCDHIRYAEQLRRFEAVLPREQILVLIYEDFRADNDATIRRVLRFLDVDDSYEFQPVETRRARKAVRFKLLHRTAISLQRARRRPAQAGRASRTVEALTAAAVRNDAVQSLMRRVVFSVPAPPDEQVARELRRRFKPEVQALSEYLGRDMIHDWGYDAID